MARDSAKTKERLLEAVDDVLARDGFGGLGVNTLAREAGVDKVLIYRYFDGLNGLLKAYAEAGDLWWTVEEITADAPPGMVAPADWCAFVLRRQVEALRRRPVTIQLLAWELIEPNELTHALTEVREARSRELVRYLTRLAGADANTRLMAVHGLLGAAATYLVLRARTENDWLGVNFAGEAGWERLYAAMTGISSAVLAPEGEGA